MSSAPTISAIPSWGDLKAGERLLMFAIRELSDDTGRCTASADDFTQVTGLGESTIRTHIKSLLKKRWIKRRRTRTSGGAWNTCTYWLDLEALELAGARADQPVEAHLDASRRPAPEIPVDQKTQGGEIQRQPQNLAVDVTAPQEDSARTPAPPREGGRVSIIFDSSTFSTAGFLFRNDEQKHDCERLLSVCGPGLGGGPLFPRVMASLIGVIDDWRSKFDFEHEVLPVVQHQTRWKRQSGPLCDFKLLTEDIEWFRENPSLIALKKRKHPKAKQSSSSVAAPRGKGGSASHRIGRLEWLIEAIDNRGGPLGLSTSERARSPWRRTCCSLLAPPLSYSD